MKQQESKIFNFDFEKITEDGSSLKNLLLKEFSPEIIDEYFQDLFSLLRQKSKIVAGYVYFDSTDMRVFNNKIKIKIKNQLFEIGKIIYRSLKDAESLYIIVCTIGEKVEKSILKFFDEGNSLEGYILDKMASELVELSADYLEFIIEREVNKSQISISNRYSPGYCGWSVTEQQKFFSLLPDNFCGIKLTPSSLMIPIKSISGIILSGKDIVKKDYDCEICDEKFCYKNRMQ